VKTGKKKTKKTCGRNNTNTPDTNGNDPHGKSIEKKKNKKARRTGKNHRSKIVYHDTIKSIHCCMNREDVSSGKTIIQTVLGFKKETSRPNLIGLRNPTSGIEIPEKKNKKKGQG